MGFSRISSSIFFRAFPRLAFFFLSLSDALRSLLRVRVWAWASLQRPPTAVAKGWSAAEAPVARIKALELAEGPHAGLTLGVHLERLLSKVGLGAEGVFAYSNARRRLFSLLTTRESQFSSGANRP